MKDVLAEYRYLWDGASPGWVLLKAPDLPGGYCVFHKTNQTLLHIESSIVNQAVCRMMMESGCEVLDDLPPGSTDVTATPI